ncbi:probable E3 ubiquitin-protein ligase HERC4 isoform X2 [Ptychodera flava]|uniref:probable E3 ubiquitin-protein ligase HERC4 isoform X2 n=1 Tax=Ptychodera flava TaxID=63121 RepID=UPI00396AAE17
MPLQCWGASSFGQLGLGANTSDEGKVVVPTEHTFFKQDAVDIGCGLHHSVVVLKDGSVFTCGSNEDSQLGQDSHANEPGQVHALEIHRIVSVSCGDAHTLVINDKDQVFSWGQDVHGQCGRGTDDRQPKPTPRLLKSLANVHVIQVACGAHHSMALTSESQIYVWGSNDSGQLGLSSSAPKSTDRPTPLTSLQGLPIRQIACGGAHSFALTVSGSVYGWGKNSSGQLGLSDQKDRYFPVLLKSLRSQMIVYISCGEEFTVALTKEGGVFSFGCGSHGQLGHGSNHDEENPRKVFELMGSRVTQVACGRRHTLAYIPSVGRVYAFGLGANGQLGNSSTYRKVTPTPVVGIWFPYGNSAWRGLNESVEVPEEKKCFVRRIYTGGDHCFAQLAFCKDNTKPLDFREALPNKEIFHMTTEFTEDLLAIPPDKKLSIEQIRKLESIFSSAGCLNASFLCSEDDEHYGSSSRCHGVDLDAVRSAFQKLQERDNPQITDIISSKLSRHLIPNLPTSPPGIEALRVYLIIMESPLLLDTSTYLMPLIMPFAYCIVKLAAGAGKVLDKWWGQLKPRFFTRILEVYRRVVIVITTNINPKSEAEANKFREALVMCMKVLEKLNRVNSSDSIPYFKFYIPEITDIIDIRQEYFKWIQQLAGAVPVGIVPFSFCNFPFVLDAKAKTVLIQTDAILQMQTAVDEVHRRNITSMFVPQINPISPCLVLHIERESIVRSTLDQLRKQGNADLKKPLRVFFLGEEAFDAGGVRKEFFMLILQDILDPKYGMFKYFDNGRTIWFNDKSFESSEMFRLVGVICGLAIYNSTIIDLQFPLALYKKLLRKPVNLEDLKLLDPEIGESLQNLLDYEDDDFEETFGLTFTFGRDSFGELEVVELMPDGKNVSVTNENRNEYVNAYVDFQLNKSVWEQFDAFSDGFIRVCGGRVLELFHPQELMAMVVGHQNYDWEEFEKNTEYKGEFYRQHPTIMYFWEVFHEMPLDVKKKFLVFLTGSDRIPILGMKTLKFIIQAVHGGEEFLPVAHTCFNLLDLAVYKSKAKLKEKLYLAVKNTQGFGLV